MTNVAASVEALEANGRVAGDAVVARDVMQLARHPSAPPPEPQPEVATAANPFSTFSLNVTDVSFKLAAASLEQGALPDASRIRIEEFLNAFNYRDPEPVRGAPVAFAWERARYPFAHNREAIRFSVQTAARGRSALRPLNLVLLLDSSGSMERADRVGIVREALSVLAQKLEARIGSASSPSPARRGFGSMACRAARPGKSWTGAAGSRPKGAQISKTR